METITGDLLDIKEGIICHQVNCINIIGGLAWQIAKKWPDWYLSFSSTGGKDMFGKTAVFQTGLPFQGIINPEWLPQHLWIASLYAQYGVGRGLQTDYGAVQSCLFSLKQALHYPSRSGYPIYFPYKIGCGLAGGDWVIVSRLIDDVFPDAIIVRRKGD